MGVSKHCSGEKEKKVRRSNVLHREKSAAIEKGKKGGASAFQLGKGAGIL